MSADRTDPSFAGWEDPAVLRGKLTDLVLVTDHGPLAVATLRWAGVSGLALRMQYAALVEVLEALHGHQAEVLELLEGPRDKALDDAAWMEHTQVLHDGAWLTAALAFYLQEHFVTERVPRIAATGP